MEEIDARESMWRVDFSWMRERAREARLALGRTARDGRVVVNRL